EAQLEAAKRTGDEVLIYQLERRMQEKEINDRFDAEAKAAEEKAAREKAEIEFRMAKQEHAMQIIKAANAAAMAVLQALSSAPPPYNFILAGISGTAATVQLGMLVSNPPKMPKFEHGGIVPGSSRTGDKIVSRLNSREMVLPLEDQAYLYDEIHNRRLGGESGGPVSATIIVMMDSREIASSTVALVNKGQYIIEARSVQ
ncbi:MAG: hypothetical protein LBI06_07280, partial [Treponema sp.]|nr:hypothetical protein [Treponema sp.]